MSWVQQQPLAQPHPPQGTTPSIAGRQYMPGSLATSATPSTLNSSKQQHHTMQQQHLGHLNNNQPTRQHWQVQNPGMMQTTLSTNKWPQQQQQNAASNTYQQPPAVLNNWQQPDLQVTATPQQLAQPTQQADQKVAANYGAYYNQPPQDNNHMQQQFQSEASFANYQQQQQDSQQQNVQSFFETSKTNNEGWGDWDWNDSTSNNNKVNATNHQQAEYNTNCTVNSFRNEGNDNWQWNAVEENLNQTEQQNQLPPTVATGTANNTIESPTQFHEHLANKVHIQQPQFSDYLTATVKPPSLTLTTTALSGAAGPTEFDVPVKNDLSPPITEAVNENFNTVAAAASSTTTTNIPNSVYVSQAKPVSKPSRQYASPPGVTPTDLPETVAMLPPQACQIQVPIEQEAVLPPPTLLPLADQAVASTPLQPPAITPTGTLPPSIGHNTSTGNPFKRAGAAQHTRDVLLPSNTTITQSLPLPPPPADFANPMLTIVSDNTEPDNSEILHENQEVIVPANTAAATQTITLPGASPQTTVPHPPPPNDERNQYLQTSHLSENPDEEVNVEADSFPPPGLSRLVLGQPELEASHRMVTGTDQVLSASVGNMNIDERHADGEDTSVEPALSIAMNPASSAASAAAINIDITTDRNLYMVAGESNVRNEQRVVTGVERFVEPAGSQIINEQREIELDGENLEDQQLQQQPLVVASRNEPPLEGAVAASTASIIPALTTASNPIDTNHNTANTRDHSNISTANDESDQLNEHHRYMKSSRKHENHPLEKKLEKQRKEKQHIVDRYESEDSEDDYPSEHERDLRRNYREGSVRSEREKERDFKEKKIRRDARHGGEDREITYSRDKHRLYNESSRSDRRPQRYNRYDADSKYETEESTRHETTISRKDRRSGRGDRERERDRVDERNTRSDRSERDYDDYRRYHHYTSKREGKRIDVEDRRERHDLYAEDDRRRRTGGSGKRGGMEEDYRDDFDPERRHRRSDKDRKGNSIEYEEYRKRSSRNAREGDLDKDRRNARQSGMYGAYPPTTAYGYDPYTYYYEQMARTNPQAYAELYKKYYGQVAVMANNHEHLTASSTVRNDGRESVHSGRSSANYEKERFTNAYISQANEYHRHFMHQQQQQQLAANLSHTFNSTMLEETAFAGPQTHQNYIYNLSGGRSTGNLSQVHATTAANAGSAYARSNYADSRSGNLSQHDAAENITTDPRRLTPCKFVNDHAVVSFSAGLLVTVKPKNTPNGISNIVKLIRLRTNDATRQVCQSFPGPLVRGLTHKKTIIEFCEEQIRLGPNNTTIYSKQLLQNNVKKYKASYTLMWNLLILLLRQNGMVVGTDIAELLLRNQIQFPHMQQSGTPNATASNSLEIHSKSESDSNEGELKDSDVESDVGEPETKLLSASAKEGVQNGEDSATSTAKITSSCSSEEQITAKFRNYLLYGNVNEALDWATDNNLWGHALFLASKVDRRSHANVMMKFANKLALNDPLQTLYQLMSGRTPSSVTSVQDEKWGDWRPHLSMILSNTSQRPELDRKAITTLGDSLFNRGDLYAAHFCYLMAQVGFGRYQDSAAQETTLQQSLPKLVLLGSSHYKSFMEFATNESIMMTEIYEYACSLNDDKFSLIEFQPYKYLLATRFLDYGYHLKSLMYMEQISTHIERDPSKFEYTFIKKVYELADRLKFYDPVLEKTLDDTQNMDENSIHNFGEQKWLQVLRNIATEPNRPNQEITTNLSTGTSDVMQGNYQQEMAEINKQFNELNMQYSNITNNATESNPYDADYLQQQQTHATSNDGIDIYSQQQQQQQTNIANHGTSSQYAHQIYGSDGNFEQQYVSTQQQQQQQQPSLYYDPAQQQTDYNTAEVSAQNSGSYDYWGGQSQHLSATEETTRPTISMPNARKPYDESDTADQRQNKSQTDQGNTSKKQSNESKNNNKSSQISSNQNSGWFGGIWNKLSLKPKNQMILPDDKNPAIVWDSEKKRWVNTDGGDDSNEDALKPPPKFSDIIPQQQLSIQQPQVTQPQQQQQQIPHQQSQLHVTQPLLQQQQPNVSASPAQLQFDHQYSDASHHQQQPAQPPGLASNTPQTYSAITTNQVPAPLITETAIKAPSLQSNMFKMQRNRTLKNAYVDVFNRSGAPMSKAVENVLAPALPPAAVPPGSFFIPGAPTGSGDSGTYQPQQQERSQDLPQFYNPNQFGGASY